MGAGYSFDVLTESVTMNHPWHDIEPGDPSVPIAFVEIPRGTKTKYELDKQSGLMLVNRGKNRVNHKKELIATN